MPTRSSPLVAFLASALIGALAVQLIPFAQACIATLDTGASYDLTRSSVSETSATGADASEEEATWAAAAILSLADQRIEFADGTHLEFE